MAIKDSICVAGIPMINGSKILEGYIPDIDATLVTRILDAGKRHLHIIHRMDFKTLINLITCPFPILGLLRALLLFIQIL